MAEKAAASRPAKKGLHGWKAFLVVFVSGTLAAFLVMGVIVGTLRLFVSTVTGGEEEEPPSAGGGAVSDQTGEPIDELEAGELDLCAKSIPTISSLSVERTDNDDDFEDTAESGEEGNRVVSDDCQWVLNPDFDSIERWDFSFSYNAIINASGEESPEDSASSDLQQRRGELEAGIQDVEVAEAGDYSDESYYVYGSPGDGETAYRVLVRTRGAVYEIQLTAKNGGEDLVPRQAFEHEVDKVVNRLDIDLGLWIPKY
ncbi:hypothetical protein [Nocardiopsis suaedae]|uniref:DUF3558 domain-containing protein n=1 Tax=Nocardiopsis suaedae TaxID=3018444 RepID=A0ABT4TFW0_9ACTN|nr:hypothetical protein [Nocardiopsis suaedae]MDA2803226.1 hypothetical protein [Nocardiopsis suaedae]